MVEHVDRLAAIEARLERGSARMDLHEQALAENTAITQEIRDLLAAFKGGFKVLGWLGTGAKWAGIFAGAGLALYRAWYAIRHGGAEPK